MTTLSIMTKELAEVLENIDCIERCIADSRKNITMDPDSESNLSRWSDQLKTLRARTHTLRDRINYMEGHASWIL